MLLSCYKNQPFYGHRLDPTRPPNLRQFVAQMQDNFQKLLEKERAERIYV